MNWYIFLSNKHFHDIPSGKNPFFLLTFEVFHVFAGYCASFTTDSICNKARHGAESKGIAVDSKSCQA